MSAVLVPILLVILVLVIGAVAVVRVNRRNEAREARAKSGETESLRYRLPRAGPRGRDWPP